MSYSKKTVPILIISLLIGSAVFSSNYSSADDSQVILSVDSEHLDVLVGNTATFSFLLENYDVDWDQTIVISTSLSGPADLPNSNLSNSSVLVPADFTETFTFSIDCSSNCSVGVMIYATISGIDNYGAGNSTNSISLTVLPVDNYAVSSSVEDANYDIVIQNVALDRTFNVENTGWSDDSYTISLSYSGESISYSLEGDDDSDGNVTLNLTGLQDSSADQTSQIIVTFQPAIQALPGSYSFDFIVVSSSGSSSSTEVSFYIPPPNFVVESLSFRPSAAALRSQEVSAVAIVNNLGGNVDENGNFATDVDVWFILNDLTISVKYVDALFYNGSTEFDFYNGPLEVTAEFVAVDFGSNNITVRIDEFSFDTDSVDIIESNEQDNSEVNRFWVVQAPPATTPSFFVSVLYLAIAAFVVSSISTYMREKENQ